MIFKIQLLEGDKVFWEGIFPVAPTEHRTTFPMPIMSGPCALYGFIFSQNATMEFLDVQRIPDKDEGLLQGEPDEEETEWDEFDPDDRIPG